MAPPLDRTTAICILGMHRSGTSCLAGALQEAGLALGEVVEWAPHNRKGNRENLEIRSLNDAVLRHSGGAWDAPPERLAWTADLATRRDACVAQLAALGSFWGFKDPRTLLTLPFWLEGIPSVRIVGSFRHPEAVAGSLRDRERMPRDHALQLWQAYNERLLAALERFEAPAICFDLDAGAYHEALGRLIVSLGLSPTGSTSQFFDETLRHQRVEDPPALPEDTARLYSALERRAYAG